MKIVVSKPDLEETLQVASIAIASSSDDLSGRYLFRFREGAVSVLTYNQRVCASAPLICQVDDAEEDDTLNVEGWRLMQWLGGIGDVPITIEDDGPGVVKLSSSRSAIRVQTKDASTFPYWDKTLADSKQTATLSAERLASAFGYARNFVYDRDTTSPALSQIEVYDGALWSTDKKAISKITIPALAESNLRINANDIAQATKFMSLKGTDEVEILEHDRSTFFRRDDGAVLGVARPTSQFPRLGQVDSSDSNETEWEVLTQDMLAGIQCLKAATSKDNETLRFSYDDDQKAVVLGVTSTAGGEDVYPIEATDPSGVDELPDNGFRLDYPYLQRIIGHFGVDSLHFGINKAPAPKKGGFVRFRHVADDDEYLTVVVWRN